MTMNLMVYITHNRNVIHASLLSQRGQNTAVSTHIDCFEVPFNSKYATLKCSTTVPLEQTDCNRVYSCTCNMHAKLYIHGHAGTVCKKAG